MKFLIISSGDHPDNEASSIRQSTIARGFVDLGHTVNFFVVSLQRWFEKEKNYKGVLYRAFYTYRGRNKFLKKIYYIQALLILRRVIKQMLKNEEVDAVIIYPNDIVLETLLIPMLQNNGVKVYHERTELPYTVLDNSILERLNYKLYLKKILPKFDGVFVINDKLESFIRLYNKKTKKILTVVDPTFFQTSQSTPFDFEYIGYCGKMSGTKDGVPILIAAFSRISKDFPNLKLVLIGDNSNKEAIIDTLNEIEKGKVQDKVVFTGAVAREAMPGLLCNARILALAKPNNEQNSGNFPIKIGEYLATGVPVVTTKVGEIHRFIVDGVSGFLAEPDSVESFASELRKALTEPEFAAGVGRNGRELAEKTFNYMVQAEEMIRFMKEI